MAASCRKVACTTQEALNSEEHKQFETLMKKYPSTRDEDGLIADYWVQKERQRFGNYPAFAGMGKVSVGNQHLSSKLVGPINVWKG
ncbi:hypothetical protein AB4M04_14415 [Serratia quinivorans]|jgi:filamentous hemagglutinin|uniref:Uncharacterized protein n=1 Tax=Serratia quinivorans TaxID=137545 RepID=A0ABV3ULX7_9GAMM|nr:hypothetical protein [Serratia quinivorans]CAI1614614.1 Uncharacterised protein [Serratia quinivorans]CAI1695003.1 Uncharacterised protein [Serratia quinivorans]